MVDSDIAALYGVMTAELNRQVQRNRDRFPSDFMFQLTQDEHESLICQIGISKKGRGGRRFSPFVFTEQGVAMLSGVLNSPRAVEVNIAIMRAFVKLRHALMIDASLAVRMERAEVALEGLEKEQGEQAVAVHELFAALRRLTEG